MKSIPDHTDQPQHYLAPLVYQQLTAPFSESTVLERSGPISPLMSSFTFPIWILILEKLNLAQKHDYVIIICFWIFISKISIIARQNFS